MNNYRKSSRRGGAVVEAAVILPVIAIIAFGIMECQNAIHLQQSITICAYEGARVSILPNTNSGNVEETCNLLLEARGITSANVTVNPNNFDALPIGTPIEVSISANLADNSISQFVISGGQQLSAAVTMMKETE